MDGVGTNLFSEIVLKIMTSQKKPISGQFQKLNCRFLAKKLSLLVQYRWQILLKRLNIKPFRGRHIWLQEASPSGSTGKHLKVKEYSYLKQRAKGFANGS